MSYYSTSCFLQGEHFIRMSFSITPLTIADVVSILMASCLNVSKTRALLHLRYVEMELGAINEINP